mmetsp:Transcript_113234/g.361379  ORF Transcript_113234/g.361379 Transcript_113234/m.361379 type:complete len:253 (-) Transcript_113234:51-809(-)
MPLDVGPEEEHGVRREPPELALGPGELRAELLVLAPEEPQAQDLVGHLLDARGRAAGRGRGHQRRRGHRHGARQPGRRRGHAQDRPPGVLRAAGPLRGAAGPGVRGQGLRRAGLRRPRDLLQRVQAALLQRGHADLRGRAERGGHLHEHPRGAPRGDLGGDGHRHLEARAGVGVGGLEAPPVGGGRGQGRAAGAPAVGGGEVLAADQRCVLARGLQHALEVRDVLGLGLEEALPAAAALGVPVALHSGKALR